MIEGESTTGSKTQNTMSQKSRRAKKPMMEKRRRARINGCLNQLKMLLVDVMKNDSLCHSKVEKADILEMTVKYLVDMQKRKLTTDSLNDMRSVNEYKSGYIECVTEVSRYLGSNAEVSPDIHNRLMDHLSNRVNSTAQQPKQISYPAAQQMATHAQPLQINIPCATSIFCLPGSAYTQENLANVGGRIQVTSPCSRPAGNVLTQLPRSQDSALVMNSVNNMGIPVIGISENTVHKNDVGNVVPCQSQGLSADTAAVHLPPANIRVKKEHPSLVNQKLILQESESMWRPW